MRFCTKYKAAVRGEDSERLQARIAATAPVTKTASTDSASRSNAIPSLPACPPPPLSEISAYLRKLLTERVFVAWCRVLDATGPWPGTGKITDQDTAADDDGVQVKVGAWDEWGTDFRGAPGEYYFPGGKRRWEYKTAKDRGNLKCTWGNRFCSRHFLSSPTRSLSHPLLSPSPTLSSVLPSLRVPPSSQ